MAFWIQTIKGTFLCLTKIDSKCSTAFCRHWSLASCSSSNRIVNTRVTPSNQVKTFGWPVGWLTGWLAGWRWRRLEFALAVFGICSARVTFGSAVSEDCYSYLLVAHLPPTHTPISIQQHTHPAHMHIIASYGIERLDFEQVRRCVILGKK